ncbi:uncharacterized protein LOC111249511 isoform X2 [Varroa destructor]|uniref:Uncharacterized protein n=1 Tax=Varroa destructor TaxID=109461 RepID=A0A7M7K0U3_VARDE|nr:uncharacterized protein LOC111249511 isoform X2 [Varroa destructor]
MPVIIILFARSTRELRRKQPQCVQSARNGLPERRKQLELPAVYLHRANMLRYEEYGKAGNIFPKDIVCQKCGILWTPSYLRVDLRKSKKISDGKLKRLQEKQTHRPWTLSKLQKKLLKQHAKMAAEPYQFRYECKLCGAKALIKVPTTTNSTGPAGSTNHFSSASSGSLNVSDKFATKATQLTRESMASTHLCVSSTLGPSRNTTGTNKNRKSLLKQVTEMSEASKLRSPLQAFLSSL